METLLISSSSNASKSKSVKRVTHMKSNRRMTTRSRMNKSKTIRSGVDIVKPNCFIDGDFFDNYDLVKNFKSKSVSKSQIMIFNKKTEPFTTLIIKKIPLLTPFDSQSFMVEEIHYKILSILVERNITPHLFLSFQSNTCSETETEKYGIIINETCNSNIFTMKSLDEFIRENIKHDKFCEAFINILFQILYTLMCFEKINFKHNDLHFGNIMLCIRNSSNILKKDWNIHMLNKYSYSLNKDGHENLVFLADTGIYARIYDFNISTKNKAETTIPVLNGEIHFKDPQVGMAYKNIIISNEINLYSDLFKLLGDLFVVAKYYKFINEAFYNLSKELFFILLRLPYDLIFTTIPMPSIPQDKLSSLQKSEIDRALQLNKLLELQLNSIIEEGYYYELPEIAKITVEIQNNLEANLDEEIKKGYVSLINRYLSAKVQLGKRAFGGIDIYCSMGYDLGPGKKIGNLKKKRIIDITSINKKYLYLSSSGKTYIPEKKEMLTPTEFFEKYIKFLPKLEPASNPNLRISETYKCIF